ncbi:hypothetical protein [Agromyces sp. SYSU T0242]|uniref:hypothetical protein n=1 Tax=Agromyces litoreus TaxID=3158561 RepID=UPI003398AF6E
MADGALSATTTGTAPVRGAPRWPPGLVDWVEDLVYTGLTFVVATLLLFEVSGLALA